MPGNVRTRVIVSWSGGKDSAMMLYRLLGDPRYEVVALATTVAAESQLVSAHGIHIDLIERQADSIGLPVVRVLLPDGPSNEEYLQAWAEALQPFQADGVASIAFGDIFLADLRSWRETSFREIGFDSIFPLWGERSSTLADEFFASGFCAVVCCVNGAFLEQTYVGRLYDPKFVQQLPPTIDPCGENGEFHTFAFAGQIFREPIHYVVGETTCRTVAHGSPAVGHWFCELIA